MRSSWWSPSAARARYSLEDANAFIFGYAVGNDLTRRDLQFAARDVGRPWDTAKGFDHSAPITAIHRVEDTGLIEKGEIWLTVNDAMKQRGNIADMIWSVPEIIVELSQLYTPEPGDLIFTGTPPASARWCGRRSARRDRTVGDVPTNRIPRHLFISDHRGIRGLRPLPRSH
jgi:2-keto-4-pentenoate hydratase/2-oxohepta-3-ene-1,7-dioic acid hydratase in catechol pathway